YAAPPPPRHTRDHDDGAREPTGAVAMHKPSPLPDRVLRVMGQDLNAALRHGAALDARTREAGSRGPCFVIDRPLKMQERAQRKARAAEPRKRLGRVRDRKG